MVDLYYVSRVFDFDCKSLKQILDKNHRVLGDFHCFLERTPDLKHSYDKFRFTGDIHRPTFDEVYSAVKLFVFEILPVGIS